MARAGRIGVFAALALVGCARGTNITVGVSVSPEVLDLLDGLDDGVGVDVLSLSVRAIDEEDPTNVTNTEQLRREEAWAESRRDEGARRRRKEAERRNHREYRRVQRDKRR